MSSYAYADAFPNSEKFFLDAFSLPDPVPALLALLKDHPTYATVSELILYYFEAAEASPLRAYTLARALLAIREAPDAPIIQGDGSTLRELFFREIADRHSRELSYNDYKHNSHHFVVVDYD